MTATVTRQAYWGVFAVVFVLVSGVGVFGQSKAAAASTSATPVARDLNSILVELMRAVPATNQDLADLQHPGGRLHWVTFWQGETAHKAQMTAALRRNLQFAVPNLIHDAQASGGSIATTFELYKDLTVVCESLDSLLPPGSRKGNHELRALSDDISDMKRLREQLSAYIQQTAAAQENKNPQLVSSVPPPVKRIIVDDTVPEKPSPKKRRPSNP